VIEVCVDLDEKVESWNISVEDVDDFSTIPTALPNVFYFVAKAEKVVIDEDDDRCEGGIACGT